MTETVAYPYSKRSPLGDRIVLENTGYKILMAGDGARGTAGNYFVRGCDFSNQLTLMSRPCRMNGTPIGVYLQRISERDFANGKDAYPIYEKARDFNADVIVVRFIENCPWKDFDPAVFKREYIDYINFFLHIDFICVI